MIENAHKHLERDRGNKPHWEIIVDSSKEVGPALFFSLTIIAVSFLPVFALTSQSGRMFSPLAFTKTYAMAAAAVLAITVVPVLMSYLIRGRIFPEHRNPINRFLICIQNLTRGLSHRHYLPERFGRRGGFGIAPAEAGAARWGRWLRRRSRARRPPSSSPSGSRTESAPTCSSYPSSTWA